MTTESDAEYEALTKLVLLFDEQERVSQQRFQTIEANVEEMVADNRKFKEESGQ